MKAHALIVLLLIMLAPRLSAALPHALACADMAASTAVQGGLMPAGANNQGAHHDHQAMMAATAASTHQAHHSEHRQHAVADEIVADLAADVIADATDNVASADNMDTASDASSGDCQHCGHCDEHCSALLTVSLPRQPEIHASDLLITTVGQQSAGFSHDLNRPPRTPSL